MQDKIYLKRFDGKFILTSEEGVRFIGNTIQEVMIKYLENKLKNNLKSGIKSNESEYNIL